MGQNNFDNKLVGRGDIGVNDVRHKIINYYPTNPSFFKNSYQEKIKVGPTEESTQDFFVLKKRAGFSVIELHEWDETEESTVLQADQDDREITDNAVIDSQRYLFAVTKDRTRMRIYKQYGIGDSTCGNVVLDPLTVGVFVNITQYEYEDAEGVTNTISHFPFNRCVFDKFVVADRVKGAPRSEGEGSLSHKIVGNEFVASINSSSPIGALEGDYVFIYDGTYAGQVSDVVLNSGSSLTVNSPWAGMWLVGQPVNETVITGVTDVGLGASTTVAGQLEQNSEEHKYKVFSEFGLILHFATADGIFHLHHDEGKPSTMVTTYNYYTHSVTEDNTKDPLKTITSFNHHVSNINFLEKGQGFVVSGLYGYNKFYFTSVNASHLGNDYTHIINFQGYMILLGPSHTAVFSTVYRGQGVVDFAFFELSDRKGYFSPDSFDTDDGKLIIFTNTNKPYSLSLEYVGTSRSESDLSVGYLFKPVRTYQYGEYAAAMRNLDRSRDVVSVTIDDGEANICTSPKYDGNGSCVGTAIYKLSIKQKFWYTRMIEGMLVRGMKNGIRFGEHLYDLVGDKDNGNDYKTLAGMFFGELSLFSPKKIDYIKVAIGGTSKITDGNTTMNIELYMDDRHQRFVYSSRGSTAYVQNIMKAKDHPDGAVMYDLPIDMAVLGGEGVGIDESVHATLANDLTEFFNFDVDRTTDTNVPDVIRVAKYGILDAPVGMICSSVYAEVCTFGDDAVELIGMFVSSDYIEVFASKPDNTFTLKDRTFAGPSGKALTNGAR